MIRNSGTDFDTDGQEKDKEFENNYDEHRINSEKKFWGGLDKTIEKCKHWCGMKNKNTNYIELEKRVGNNKRRNRKCWCYIIPGKHNHFLY